eukprot:520399_1
MIAAYLRCDEDQNDRVNLSVYYSKKAINIKTMSDEIWLQCMKGNNKTTTEIMLIFGSCSMSVHTKAKHLPSKYITHDAPTSVHPVITLLNRYNSTDKSPPPPQHDVSSNTTVDSVLRGFS